MADPAWWGHFARRDSEIPLKWAQDPSFKNCSMQFSRKLSICIHTSSFIIYHISESFYKSWFFEGVLIQRTMRSCLQIAEGQRQIRAIGRPSLRSRVRNGRKLRPAVSHVPLLYLRHGLLKLRRKHRPISSLRRPGCVPQTADCGICIYVLARRAAKSDGRNLLSMCLSEVFLANGPVTFPSDVRWFSRVIPRRHVNRIKRSILSSVPCHFELLLRGSVTFWLKQIVLDGEIHVKRAFTQHVNRVKFKFICVSCQLCDVYKIIHVF